MQKLFLSPSPEKGKMLSPCVPDDPDRGQQFLNFKTSE